MHISSSVASISWIPSEAISGHVRLPMDIGLGHYDNPPPDAVTDLAELAAAGAFRFANELRASIEVEDGKIVSASTDSRSHICGTDLSLGSKTFQFAAVAFPNIEAEPEIHADHVIFRRTAGGRTGAPMPRRINRAPFVMLTAPTAWTTLELVINIDGSSHGQLAGASPFPRHWVYDAQGSLVGKSATTDFAGWARENFKEQTPWGGHDEATFVTEVETALERELSLSIMRGGASPELRRFSAGELLTEQGSEGADLYLVLDGVLEVEVDGTPLADVGPGAILGERALLEGGTRTATLRAVTDGKIAVAGPDAVDTDKLLALSQGHRREESA